MQISIEGEPIIHLTENEVFVLRLLLSFHQLNDEGDEHYSQKDFDSLCKKMGMDDLDPN